MTEGGWDRPHDRARSLGERDGNDEGDEDDDDEYGEDGDIPDDSAPPAESIARSRPESQRASVPSH